MDDTSTLRDVRPAAAGPAPRWAQRAGIALLLAVVITGATGWLGVHTVQQRVQGTDGYVLTVTYPKVARAGLDAPFRVRVHHDGGFSADLSIAISLDYFRMWETQGFFPDPDSTTNDGDTYVLTFAKPPGEDFQLDYDAYIQPAAQLGKGGHVRVIMKGSIVAQTAIHTWLAP